MEERLCNYQICWSEYWLGWFIGYKHDNTNQSLSVVGEPPYDIATSLHQQGVSVLHIAGNGNVGIGTSTPYSKLTVWGTDTASTSAFAVVNSASTTVLSAYDNGNVTYSGLLYQAPISA